MATTFMEPGGDATFKVDTQFTSPAGFWYDINGSPSVVSDIVHSPHLKAIKYRSSGFDLLFTRPGTATDSGTRISVYIYIDTLPGSTAPFLTIANSGTSPLVQLQITSSGVLQLWNFGVAQIGANGSTLSTGQWYRISLAYTISTTTINRFELFKNGVSDISVTNATIAGISSSLFGVGDAYSSDVKFVIRTSDYYIDNSSSLTDTGNIWVTAKRPFANGTTNGFTTQIGSGGSGYGTGHSPQVNERPLSTTNGWSMIGAGSAITEEYNIENQATGDINITGGSIVDYMGWVNASALASETAQIIVNNVTNNIALTSTNAMFTQAAGSTSYPAGTGTDIGIVTTTALTTVSLYECGIMVAYIPFVPSVGSMLTMFQ